MTDPKTTAPAEYEVMQSREIAGLYRKKGETVFLTLRQAKYYLPPYGSGLKTPGPKQEVVGSLDDPKVRNPDEHATGKPGKAKA